LPWAGRETGKGKTAVSSPPSPIYSGGVGSKAVRAIPEAGLKSMFPSDTILLPSVKNKTKKSSQLSSNMVVLGNQHGPFFFPNGEKFTFQKVGPSLYPGKCTQTVES
jgi:hypothetical protein